MDFDKIILPMSPCPWCKETPEVSIYEGSGGTWLCDIRCENPECKIKPVSFYVPIRNTSKKDPKKIEQKIKKIFSYWNENNPFSPTHGKCFDFNEIAEKGFPFLNQKFHRDGIKIEDQ